MPGRDEDKWAPARMWVEEGESGRERATHPPRVRHLTLERSGFRTWAKANTQY